MIGWEIGLKEWFGDIEQRLHILFFERDPRFSTLDGLVDSRRWKNHEVRCGQC